MQTIIDKTAKILTLWMPVSSIRRRCRNKIINFFETAEIKRKHKNYNKILQRIKLKVKNGQKINVGFFVIYDSSFSTKPLFEKMLEDDLFNPHIVIIPDTYRGKENMFYQMDKAYDSLSKKYNCIFKSYDTKNSKFIDYTDKFDIICTANPYDAMTHKLYQVKYFSKKCLSFYANYFYFGRTNHELNVAKSFEFNSFWKIFIENKNTEKILNRENIFNKNNAIITGYIKMDEYFKYQSSVKQNNRKKIFITPHHTVENNIQGLTLSNFFKYSDFFLKLPEIYPNIDFIFRPHPLLFITLQKDDYWGKEKVDKYISKLKKIPNLEYQEGGSYMKTFAESDCIINDCGSFLAEYFYTGKPQCYMLNSNLNLNVNFLPEGIEMLNNTYKAFSEKDIINFIDNVVINNNDSMKHKRIEFSNKNIKINYPKAAEYALNYLKQELI